MGTLANRLDKLDNKFTVIEREVEIVNAQNISSQSLVAKSPNSHSEGGDDSGHDRGLCSQHGADTFTA